MLDELERLAARLGVEVRFESLLPPVEGKGGLCVLRGTKLLVIDSRLALEEKIGVLAEAMATFDLDAMYIPPLVRERVTKRNAPARPPARPLARARMRKP
jgi:hypothetical protein